MGWTCQHDHQGYCKLVRTSWVPGMKGCTLTGDFLFAKESSKHQKKDAKPSQESIDFSTLVRSH